MTTETETTVQALAREAADWFEGATRPRSGVGSNCIHGERGPCDCGEEGQSIRKLKEGRPEWVVELVKDAHGDLMPDDWRYNVIENALLAIADSDDPEDGRGEFADGEVDVYNAARVKWLESSIYRGAYCDDAAQEFGSSDQGIYERIGLGQYAEADEVYGLVLAFLEGQVEDGIGS